MNWINQYIVGDCIEVMKQMPDGIVQTVVTSPPYFGLRTYGVDGQYGLEPTPEEHIAKMVEVFREVKRILRKDGVVFLNYGDSYAGGGCHEKPIKYADCPKPNRPKVVNLKPKDLCMIPARVALALQADGWWLRSDIIWAKPNPMPESCTDRPTSSYEHIFLLAKNQKYFYDADAVREKHAEATIERCKYPHGERKRPRGDTADFKDSSFAEKVGGYRDYIQEHGLHPHPAGRNLRNVWTIPTHPYPDAHFATFPPALVKRCVLAGTSHRACEVCGAAWERVVEVEREKIGDSAFGDRRGSAQHGANISREDVPQGRTKNTYTTAGFRPTCHHTGDEGTGKCVVLDPFMGSGTVAEVATGLGRDWIGIDINPSYKKMAMKRIQGATIGLGL